ncbi:hypothetical protein EJB05_26141, partial [Eragrostis curvula]
MPAEHQSFRAVHPIHAVVHPPLSQVNQTPTLPSRGRPKRLLLESTSDFPADFQFSCSRHELQPLAALIN